MSAFPLPPPWRRAHARQRSAALPIRCRAFAPGREDWNRGLREPRGVIVHEGCLARLADGAVRLQGSPGVDLRLDLNAEQVERILARGLRITASALEIEIDADAFRAALAVLPDAATVVPFAADRDPGASDRASGAGFTRARGRP